MSPPAMLWPPTAEKRFLSHGILPHIVLLAHIPDRFFHLPHVSLGLLDCRIPVPLPLPPNDVVLEFRVPALFFLDVFAQFALVRLQISVEDQLEAACLPCPVLFRALLTEMPRHDKGG